MCFFLLYVEAYVYPVCPKPKPQNWTRPLFLLCFAICNFQHSSYIIQVSKFQTGSLVSAFFYLFHFIYIPLLEVFLEENASFFFFFSLQSLFWLWFSLSNLNWLEFPSGLFCKIAIKYLFGFWLHLVWLLRKWWKINATKKLVEDFEYWGFH